MKKTKPFKILFLDIDGVCNKQDNFDRSRGFGLYPLDSYCAFLVGRITLRTGCKVVLSSSWRHSTEAVKNVSERVVELLDKTVDYVKYDGVVRHSHGRDWDHSLRGDEVNEWLSRHPEVTKYAILDDDCDFYDNQPLFQTTFKEGLTEEIAEKVIECLNAEPQFHSYDHMGFCIYCDEPDPEHEEQYIEYEFNVKDICNGQ